jgi:hypothetical protein
MSASFDNNESQPSADDNIPDWMKSSGWVPSNNEEQQPQESYEPSGDTRNENQEAAPSEIPDWLKSLSQGQDVNVQPEAEQNPVNEPPSEVTPPAFIENAEWMNKVMSEEGAQKEQKGTDLPDWLKNFDAEGSDQPASKDDLPDWLSSLKTEDQQKASAPNPFLDFTATESKNEPEEPEITEVKAKTGPISEEAEKTEEISPEVEPEKPLSFDLENSASSWQPAQELSEVRPESTPTSEDDADSTITKETEDDLLDWLRNLKPADSTAETPSEAVAQEVPEESIEIEDQRYDFASQLERLQQFNQPPQTEESKLAEETISEIVEKPADEIAPEENLVGESSQQEGLSTKEEIAQEVSLLMKKSCQNLKLLKLCKPHPWNNPIRQLQLKHR